MANKKFTKAMKHFLEIFNPKPEPKILVIKHSFIILVNIRPYITEELIKTNDKLKTVKNIKSGRCYSRRVSRYIPKDNINRDTNIGKCISAIRYSKDYKNFLNDVTKDLPENAKYDVEVFQSPLDGYDKGKRDERYINATELYYL
jgi:hypothetical protein